MCRLISMYAHVVKLFVKIIIIKRIIIIINNNNMSIMVIKYTSPRVCTHARAYVCMYVCIPYVCIEICY